jgi:hypothetical protein
MVYVDGSSEFKVLAIDKHGRRRIVKVLSVRSTFRIYAIIFSFWIWYCAAMHDSKPLRPQLWRLSRGILWNNCELARLQPSAMLELHIWGPGFGLPSIDPHCLAAIAYLQQAIPKGKWELIASSDTSLSPSSTFTSTRRRSIVLIVSQMSCLLYEMEMFG